MKKEIPVKNFYYLLSYAWNLLAICGDDCFDQDNFLNSTNLMAKLMDISFKQLMKKGLDKAYVLHADEIRGIRGKVCLSDTLKTGKFQYGKTICEFDEFSYDSLNNRIIKATINTLSDLSDIEEENYKRLKKINAQLAAVSDIEITSADFEKVRLNVSNRYYRFILELCELIYKSLTVSDKSGNAVLPNFIDETLKKNRVFEKFVKNFYQRHLRMAKVSSSKFDWQIGDSSDELFKNRIPELRTDVVIDFDGSRVIIDAKYYSEALKQTFGGGFKYRRDHLSQLMEYLRTSQKVTTVQTIGMLLYPTVDVDIEDKGHIEGFDIRVATVDLSKSWREIEARMLDLVTPIGRRSSIAA